MERIETMVLRDVPRVLEQDPGFVVFLEGLTSEGCPRRDDIEDLAEKVLLVRPHHPAQNVHGVWVMLGAEKDHRELCDAQGPGLIP